MAIAGITPDQLQRAIEILVKEFNPVLIYLFGSAVRSELRVDSDIDLAFLSDKTRDGYEVFRVAQQLAEVFNRDVDLIDLQKASTVMKAQIVAYGKHIYETDLNRRINFEIVALKEYALLNEERQVVLDSFVKGENSDAQ
ncbi:MAG TPA: nucleotidyltransferase domain-containing protein [Bacillota bacterium]|nr:nucleotidyltransferase domain-containing protein [Bacillota bacterium]